MYKRQADDYAEFAAYVYQRPELRRRRYLSHLRFAVLMVVVLLGYLVWQTWDGHGPNWSLLLPVYFEGLAVGLGILAVLALAYEFVLPGLVRMNTRRMLAKRPDGLFPVSYTHLDVYKRQAEGLAARPPGPRP